MFSFIRRRGWQGLRRYQDAHMLCLVHNLATQRTSALGLPVWRYRFDLIANNLNSRGAGIGAFHGSLFDRLDQIND
jgi:hypothetical protein